MKISNKIVYGLQALQELAFNFEKGGISTAEIARSQSIPPRFLEQILITLKRKGLLESSRGAGGGYALTRSPREISLLDVVVALEGPIISGKQKKGTVISIALNKVKIAVETNLSGVSIEDLLDLKQQKDKTFIYSI